MAKIQLGGLVSQASGSVGGTVYSRNRYGTYTRRRAHPTNTSTPAVLAARQRLSNQSQAFQLLTSAQQRAWATWAKNNPVMDVLGERQTLTGHSAFVKLNTLLVQAGDSAIDEPPIAGAPVGLTSLSLSADIGAGTFGLTFAPTPLGADERLVVRAAVVDSAAVNYVKNLLKLVVISSKAQATGYDIQSAIESRFGALSVGQVVHVQVGVLDSTTGLQSQPITARATVVSTP